ncbi:hypothetical protein BKH34_04085 [Actinomyces naeslundii]|jgi:hypothetical protein|nr:hypothetical protein BKH34_04085 [Actinomyces naeslundii]
MLTLPTGMKRDRLAGEKQTIRIAPIPRMMRKSVPMGSVPHPSALAVNWFESFMATPIMNSRIGRAKIAPTATPAAMLRRRRPFLDVTSPHMTPRPVDPKYATKNWMAKVTTSMTPARKNRMQITNAPSHPSGEFAVVSALNGSSSEPVMVVDDDPIQSTTPADKPSARSVQTNVHIGVNSNPRNPSVRDDAHF